MIKKLEAAFEESAALISAKDQELSVKEQELAAKKDEITAKDHEIASLKVKTE